MAEVVLDRAPVAALTRKLEPASVPQHVRVNLEREPSIGAGTLDELGEARGRERRTALGHEHVFAVRVVLAPASLGTGRSLFVFYTAIEKH